MNLKDIGWKVINMGDTIVTPFTLNGNLLGTIRIDTTIINIKTKPKGWSQ